MNDASSLQPFEQEAKRLRTAYADDLLVRAAIGFDLAIRRAAHRLLRQARAFDVHRPVAR